VADLLLGPEPVEFTVTVTNRGPDSAQNVVLTQTLPGTASVVSVPAECTLVTNTLSCEIGTLTAGASIDFTFVIKPLDTGTATIGASVGTETHDTRRGNDQKNVTLAVLDPNGDEDADGVSNLDEFNAGTNPLGAAVDFMIWLPLLFDR